MILKYFTTCNKGMENERGQWNYIDGITSASTFYDKEHEAMCVHIYNGNECEAIMPVYETAYLLNDMGKTIDCIKR